MKAVRSWIASFKPARMQGDRIERIRACVGALIGIFVTGISSYWLIGNSPQLPMLIAPLGASAVLLFAVPNGPLAQPWPVLGGNTLSALVGVTALMLFDNVAVAAAVGVGGAIGVMFLTRSLHPPGGAVALATVMGGDAVLQQGYSWALVPVGLESLLLLVVALIYNNATGRRYPQPTAQPAPNVHRTGDLAPGDRLGFTQQDLERVLARYEQVLDVSPSDLNTVLKQTELEAWRRRMGEIRCRDIMSRDLVTASRETPLREAWKRMQHHRIKALPVIDNERRVIGIVTLLDFLTHARLDDYASFRDKLGRFLGGRSGATDLGAIMASPVQCAHQEEHIAALVPLLSDAGRHHIPVVDDEHRLTGMVTQSDLVAALYRGAATQR